VGLVFPLVRIVSVPGGRACSFPRLSARVVGVGLTCTIRLVPRVRTDHRVRARGPARLRSRARHQLHSDRRRPRRDRPRGRAPRPPAEPSRGLRRRRHAARARRRRGACSNAAHRPGAGHRRRDGRRDAQLATIMFSFAASGAWGRQGRTSSTPALPSTTSTNPRTAASWRSAPSSPSSTPTCFATARSTPQTRRSGTARWPELRKRLSDGPLDGLSRPSSGIEAGRPGQAA
jgi:hypothetical protein